MRGKIFAILMLMLAMFSFSAYAQDVNVDNGVRFVSQSGAVIRAFPSVSSSSYTMYASADIKNESTASKDMVLFVAVYDGNNNLETVTYKNITVPAGSDVTEKLTITIPQGRTQSDFVCKAYLWDSIFGGTAYRAESVFLDQNTNLNGILIGDMYIEGYSDDIDYYSVKVKSAGDAIKLFPKSGSTQIAYDECAVPGTTVIKLTNGNERREIVIDTYLKESDNYTLSSLTYKIGDTEYEIEDFDREVYEYTVVLPDNTFYVKVQPEAHGDITCKVQDINDTPNIVNGVQFGKMRSDTTGPAYVYPRDMIDGIVPIKNEKTKALINVTDGTNSSDYVINFTCVQPRLTAFNQVGGPNDSYVPVFTSGAGFNNDNGTIACADRLWAAANISKKMIGASYFMSPFNNKSGQWWNDESREAGDEYFNFTADTAGTVYMMTGADPGDYSDWEKVNNGTAPSHPDGFKLGDKSWNDYDNTDYFIECVKWNSNVGRCDECGVAPMTSAQGSYIDACVSYRYVYAKHFEAGETVSVTHTGLFGDSAAEIIWAVVWDVDVNYPEADDSEDEGEGDEGDDVVTEEGLVLDLDASNNTGEGILDEFTDVWLDLSSNEYDVTLTDSCQWGTDCLVINTGTDDSEDAVTVNSAVTNVINTYNFTVEFELSQLDDDAVVADSENGKFSIREDGGELIFYFGGLNKRYALKIDTEDALSGYNQITVSRSDNNVTMKWYVDGVEKGSRSVNITSPPSTDEIMLGSYKYPGEVAINRFRVFDYAKTITTN